MMDSVTEVVASICVHIRGFDDLALECAGILVADRAGTGSMQRVLLGSLLVFGGTTFFTGTVFLFRPANRQSPLTS